MENGSPRDEHDVSQQLANAYKFVPNLPVPGSIEDVSTSATRWEARIADLTKLNDRYVRAFPQRRLVTSRCLAKTCSSIKETVDSEMRIGARMAWQAPTAYLSSLSTSRHAPFTEQIPEPMVMHTQDARPEQKQEDNCGHEHHEHQYAYNNWLQCLSAIEGVTYVQHHPKDFVAAPYVNFMYANGSRVNGK